MSYQLNLVNQVMQFVYAMETLSTFEHYYVM